jgi:hypothetical protein
MNSFHSFVKRSGLLGLVIILLSFSCSNEKQVSSSPSTFTAKSYIALSVELIESVKAGQDPVELRKKLARLRVDSLATHLRSDEQKKAFWINVYNAYVQLLLKENPKHYENRSQFFSEKQIPIARNTFSLDEIEHGIIRGSQWKYAFGYIKNPFASKEEKMLRVDKVDGRIHFALNCGAMSCPPIAIFHSEDFDQKVDKVIQQFLQANSFHYTADDRVNVSSLFNWFKGDFGGKKGVYSFLNKYSIIPEGSKPDLQFNKYNWQLKLDNYYEEE